MVSTISAALGRSSFANIAEPVISVSVAGDQNPTGDFSSLESQREAAESALVSSARTELQELSKTVINEFDRQIRAHKSSFLGFARGINVRFVSDGNYPTFSNQLSRLESDRGAGEEAVRAKILSLEMNLVKSLNRIGAAALGAA